MADGRIYVATTSVVTTVDGKNRAIHRDQTAREGHPILESHGHLFVPLVPDFEVDERDVLPAVPEPDSGQVLAEQLLSHAPDDWDSDEPAHEVAVAYVRHLEDLADNAGLDRRREQPGGDGGRPAAAPPPAAPAPRGTGRKGTGKAAAGNG